MALGLTPSIVTNGLIFACDMANRKSYRGPQISNLTQYINTTGIGTSAGYQATDGTEVIDIPQIGPTTVKFVNIQNNYPSVSGNCCPSLFQYGGYSVSPSTLYTYGIVYKVDSGYTNGNYMYRYEYNGGSYVTEAGVHDTNKRVYLGDGWWWAWNTFTTNPSTNLISSSGLWYYQYSTFSDKVSVGKIFVSQGDWTGLHPKYWPDSATTRSNTQTVTDLMGNSTVTANSLTYATDGSVSFNGSTNYISIATDILNTDSQFTLQAWLRPNGSNWNDNAIPLYNTYANSSNIGFWHHFGLDNVLRWRHAGNTYTDGNLSGHGLVANTWQMTTITWDGSTIRLYKNDVLQNSAAAGGFNKGTQGARIGMLNFRNTANDYNWKGDIGLHTVYNKPLSLAEIRQNFNAHRSRYGL